MFNKLRKTIAGLLWTQSPPTFTKNFSTPDDCTFYKSHNGNYAVYMNGLIQSRAYDYRFVDGPSLAGMFLISCTKPIRSEDDIVIK